MNRKIVTIFAVVAVATAGCGVRGINDPTEDLPDTPKPVRTKYIDPPLTRCVKYKRVNGKTVCAKKETDDKDYVVVTTDGKSYDVDKTEYDKVVVGKNWAPTEK